MPSPAGRISPALFWSFSSKAIWSCEIARRKSNRYWALNPISISGPLYSLDTLSSLSPVSTLEENTRTSPAANCTRMARDRSSANCATRSMAIRELYPDGPRPLVGKLRHAVDGRPDFRLFQLGDELVILGQHPLIVRKVSRQFARNQQAVSDL